MNFGPVVMMTYLCGKMLELFVILSRQNRNMRGEKSQVSLVQLFNG